MTSRPFGGEGVKDFVTCISTKRRDEGRGCMTSFMNDLYDKLGYTIPRD